MFKFVCLIWLSISTSMADEAIGPLKPYVFPNKLAEAKAYLGQKLFADKKLSRDGSVSCLSCHDIERGGADQHELAIGINGSLGTFNTPTIFNSQLNFRQFWDGRVDTLSNQIVGPLENPREMDINWNIAIQRLKQDKEYLALFDMVYGNESSPETVKDAIVFYESTLITSNSRFDRYLLGDKNAISADEKLGYEKFKSYGCISCHQGDNIGGNMYQTMGVAKDYFHGKVIKNSDKGLFNVTKRIEDMHVFKVPSLRMAVLTPPYFHDGSAKTIEEAIIIMGQYQLGRDIDAKDVQYLKEFLKSVVGTPPKKIKNPLVKN